MKSLRLSLIAAALLAVVVIWSEDATAGYPPYLLLRAPTAPLPHRPTHGYHPGYGFAVEAQAYSYGWFGVKPRRHWSRHFGYYRNYTEWSAR
jgi:hypothetical protein